MEPITITLKRAVFIIKQHGNLDELEDFFKTLGRKKVYKTKDVKSWLGYWYENKSYWRSGSGS